MTTTRYETDVLAWSNEQARLLRAGQFGLLDLEHIAEEIEDVGKSEQRELASRLAVLMAHLLKWHYQPERQSASWQRTIKEQRRALTFHLKQVPSLQPRLADAEWLGAIWADAITRAIEQTGMGGFPEECPWAVADLLSQDWLP
ncbi:MAG: DUF29 domain-containing protein [Chromatiaceae bacterium]|nr:DUF29 domain-containing protein [Chromatiaceae bacterium]